MPYWKVYYNADLLTEEEKSAISKAATNFYVAVGLPDFYLNVFFLPLTPSNFYVGGKPESSKISIEVLHVARNWDGQDKDTATRLKNALGEIWKPYTLDKGVQLEISVVEGPAELWRINNIDPPEGFQPDQKELAEKNKKLLYESTLV